MNYMVIFCYQSTDLTIYNDALAQCLQKLQDRFLIMDVKTTEDPEVDASTFQYSLRWCKKCGQRIVNSQETTFLSYDYDLSVRTITQS